MQAFPLYNKQVGQRIEHQPSDTQRPADTDKFQMRVSVNFKVESYHMKTIRRPRGRLLHARKGLDKDDPRVRLDADKSTQKIGGVRPLDVQSMERKIVLKKLLEKKNAHNKRHACARTVANDHIKPANQDSAK